MSACVKSAAGAEPYSTIARPALAVVVNVGVVITSVLLARTGTIVVGAALRSVVNTSRPNMAMREA